jgi:DNA modification methylase
VTVPTWSILQGDAEARLKELPDGHFHACFCDPPYGLDLAAWDGQVPGPSVWREVFRVLKPGGHLLAFGGTRLWHRLAVAIEEGGFEVRDTLLWLYGTGQVKALDISKALDRRRFDREDVLKVTAWIRGARDAAGLTNADLDRAFGFAGMASHWTSPASQPTVPTLDQVPQLLELLGVDPPADVAHLLVELNGRKGQPGEAWFRRELVGVKMAKDTKAARPLPLASQGVDYSGRKALELTAAATPEAKRWEGWWTALRPSWEPAILAMKPVSGTYAENAMAHGVAGLNIEGSRILRNGEDPRWPANAILDPDVGRELDHQVGGNVSRYFYSAKVSAEEREGLTHPTMKPLALTEHFARLLLPPPGAGPRRLVVPFAGVGSEVLGALRAGWDEVLGIELSGFYAVDAEDRIHRWQAGGSVKPLELEDMPLFAGLEAG